MKFSQINDEQLRAIQKASATLWDAGIPNSIQEAFGESTDDLYIIVRGLKSKGENNARTDFTDVRTNISLEPAPVH
jgi:hypothetical protein